MPAERYYTDYALDKGTSISLQNQEFHHLVRVMRAAVGDSVELVNGRGSLAQATIANIDKRHALLTITACKHVPKPSFEVILAQAIPRMNRLEFILEKGTELGMTQLWLFPGEYSEKKELSDNQLVRAHAITIAAMKQCGRLWQPTLEIKSKLTAWQNVNFTGFYGDVAQQAESLRKAWERLQPKQGVLFWIGPESGFSDKEEEKLKQLGAHGVTLHPNILRTDTAALAALTLLYSLVPSEHKL